MAALMSATRRASRDYPSVIVEGHRLHVCQMSDGWEVWLNTEAADFDGLCIGAAATRDAAVADAVRVLEAATDYLQGPPQGK